MHNEMHTFWGSLHASTRTITQSALSAALRTFFIIIESNLCIFFSITPGVSYSISCKPKCWYMRSQHFHRKKKMQLDFKIYYSANRTLPNKFWISTICLFAHALQPVQNIKTLCLSASNKKAYFPIGHSKVNVYAEKCTLDQFTGELITYSN